MDYIIFPNGFDFNAPLAYVDTENTVDFGELDDFTTVSEELTVINFGNQTLEGTISVLSHSLLVRKVFVVSNLALELNVMRTLDSRLLLHWWCL